MKQEARGECPACEMPIPFAQTIMWREKPFSCRGCGANLVVTKPNLVLLMGVMAIALILAKFGGLLAFVVIVMMIAIGDWKLARTRVLERPEA